MTETVHHIYPHGGELNVLCTETTNKPIVTRPMKHKSANDSQQKQSVWTNKEMMSKRNSSFDFARYFLRRQDFFSPGSKTSKRREENPEEEEGDRKGEAASVEYLLSDAWHREEDNTNRPERLGW